MAKSYPLSPLAPKQMVKPPALDGVRFATCATGDYMAGRDNVLIMQFPPETKMAAALTRSTLPAAPVIYCRSLAKAGRAEALIVNAGNANAFTGRKGREAIYAVTAQLGAHLRVPADHVFMASTGVIGEPLNVPPLIAQIKKTAPLLAEQDNNDDWQAAAAAIRTTDTFNKVATRSAKIGDVEVQLTGIAKGSGMIAPNMATMLGFIFTDAALSHTVLRHLLADAIPNSFNAITVDGDMSTSDMVLFFATQAKPLSGAPFYNGIDKRLGDFRKALRELMQELAQLIIRDGEGASKFITIDVKGARDKDEARQIGFSIANSPLVKTAIAGGDANWGRLIMAIGKSGVPVLPEALTISIGEHKVARGGKAARNVSEAKLAQYLSGSEITLTIALGQGKGKARIWTSDLTHDYIDINADYRS